MKTEDIKVAVMVMEGTNNEDATYDAFRMVGATPEIVHLNQFQKKDISNSLKRTLDEYQCLFIPGGFSAGDYVRAGAIWASRMRATMKEDLKRFVDEGKPIGGICNGFQVLVELGLLPGSKETIPDMPDAILRRNESAHFECRHVLLKHTSKGKCVWTNNIEKDAILEMPVAHGEGNFTLPKDKEDQMLKQMVDDDRIVFRYSDNSGNTDAGYPWNPNGALYNIAGICNEQGNVFGMMPHPERVMERYTLQRWYTPNPKDIKDDTKGNIGPGYGIFSSVTDYIKRRF